MILAIAAGHGIFVLLFRRTRFSLIVAAIISGAFGVLTGNPAYMGADLLGVAIGFFIGWSLVGESKAVNTKQHVEEAPKNSESSGVVWIVIVVCAVLYYKNLDKAPEISNPQPTYSQPPTYIAPENSPPEVVNNGQQQLSVNPPELIESPINLQPLVSPPITKHATKLPLSKKAKKSTFNLSPNQNEQQVNNPYKNLYEAVSDDNIEVAEQMINTGANPNYSQSGLPVLVRAVLNNNLDMVTLLLSHGANPDARDLHGFNVVAHAKNVQHPNKEIIDILFQFGATNPYQ